MIPESRFLESKYLNTPRLVADDTQKTVWKWEQQEPFGGNPANADPDGDTQQFEFNLRLPGQYFDSETASHYNGYRDFSPTIGRYVESDPIGLEGGLNTYGYVVSRPLEYVDPDGRVTILTGIGLTVAAVAIVATSSSTIYHLIEKVEKAVSEGNRSIDAAARMEEQFGNVNSPRFDADTLTTARADNIKAAAGFGKEAAEACIYFYMKPYRKFWEGQLAKPGFPTSVAPSGAPPRYPVFPRGTSGGRAYDAGYGR